MLSQETVVMGFHWTARSDPLSHHEGVTSDSEDVVLVETTTIQCVTLRTMSPSASYSIAALIQSPLPFRLYLTRLLQSNSAYLMCLPQHNEKPTCRQWRHYLASAKRTHRMMRVYWKAILG